MKLLFFLNDQFSKQISTPSALSPHFIFRAMGIVGLAGLFSLLIAPQQLLETKSESKTPKEDCREFSLNEALLDKVAKPENIKLYPCFKSFLDANEKDDRIRLANSLGKTCTIGLRTFSYSRFSPLEVVIKLGRMAHIHTLLTIINPDELSTRERFKVKQLLEDPDSFKKLASYSKNDKESPIYIEQFIENKIQQLQASNSNDIAPEETELYIAMIRHLLRHASKSSNQNIGLLLQFPSIKNLATTSNRLFNLALICKNKEAVRIFLNIPDAPDFLMHTGEDLIRHAYQYGPIERPKPYQQIQKTPFSDEVETGLGSPTSVAELYPRSSNLSTSSRA